MNFKISEWNDDDEENEAKENNQLPTKETKSKMLILIGTVICEFDGNDWTFFPLIDQDKIENGGPNSATSIFKRVHNNESRCLDS